MRDKIFVTGVYGAGKTYFSKKLAEAYSDHTFISFDRNFYEPTILHPNSLTIPPILRLWEQIKKHNKLIIDGVPCDVGKDWASFYTYYKTHDCQLIVLKPDIDVWQQRLLASPWFNPLIEENINIRPGTHRREKQDIDIYRQNFNDFYSSWLISLDDPSMHSRPPIWLDPDNAIETLIEELENRLQ